jgi:hypothetical protein
VGDAASGPIRLAFNSQLRVEFRGATVTSDAGLLLPRELNKRLGLDALIEQHLTDPRSGHNRQFPLPDLFRQSIYSRLADYEDTNDAERLAEDPTFRMLASRRRRETSVALTSTLHWFETDVLTEERNYQGLARVNTALIQHAAARSATPEGERSISTAPRVPCTGRESSRRTTAISSPSAITRSSSSARRTTASQPSSGRVTSTVRTGGTRCSSPSLTGTARIAARAQLDVATADAVWSDGAAMTLEQADHSCARGGYRSPGDVRTHRVEVAGVTGADAACGVARGGGAQAHRGAGRCGIVGGGFLCWAHP